MTNRQKNLKNRSAQEIIEKLGLEPLDFEGGYFRQSYKCANSIHASNFGIESKAPRSFSTAIYYLVTPENFSALHVVRSDEIFHFYAGDPVEIIQITTAGKLTKGLIGPDIFHGECPQVVVPGGVWQGLKIVSGGKWCLMGTTVSPGFEYEDFELGNRANLTDKFPAHADIIATLTRE